VCDCYLAPIKQEVTGDEKMMMSVLY